MSTITSVSNTQVKQVVQLHQSKGRQKDQQILIEGEHVIQEALNAGLDVHTIFIREGESLSFEGNIVYATEHVMEKMSTTTHSAKCLAVASMPKAKPVNTKQRLALYQLQDPGNMGTLIRSACAFGFEHIVLVGSCVDPYNPKVIRSSVGMVFHQTFAQVETLEELREDAVVYAAQAGEQHAYNKVIFEEPRVLLVGSEAHGLPKSVWSFAKPISIPMVSQVESLNAAVAGSIIMAHVFNQNQQ